MTAKVRTCLWFVKDGPEAARFWTGLLPDSRIETEWAIDTGAPPIIIDFTLAGTPYQILNVQEGPAFAHSEAASISVLTDDQAETDRLWAALTADGGREVQCGWLKDRFGVSWQIVPHRLIELQSTAAPEVRTRVHQAMMTMVKIDIAAIEAAARGE